MSEQAINGDGHLKPSVEVESDDEHTPLNRISHRRRSSYIEPKLIRLTGTSLESGDLEFDPAVETRLLVLYSGGTIGMKSYDGGKVTFCFAKLEGIICLEMYFLLFKSQKR